MPANKAIPSPADKLQECDLLNSSEFQESRHCLGEPSFRLPRHAMPGSGGDGQVGVREQGGGSLGEGKELRVVFANDPEDGNLDFPQPVPQRFLRAE